MGKKEKGCEQTPKDVLTQLTEENERSWQDDQGGPFILEDEGGAYPQE